MSDSIVNFDNVEYNERHQDVLSVLADGRGTISLIADETGTTRPHIKAELQWLVHHDLVKDVADGVFEITASGRDMLD
ncbi:hypothetical protein V5735_01580 (plasmid) [Haladaptatus sp. SPP-AMP-3]|uniref:hypothetical protein n=1 Tax=Haladaptatus sp. SPP-AMP-3 TaxID=3121295 RepID=UPI003C2D72AF